MTEIFPNPYVNPVFRPPSEADLFTLPITIGWRQTPHPWLTIDLFQVH